MLTIIKKIEKEILSNKSVYFLLALILALSAFFRLYKLNIILGFWYDQGRDALVIWDFIHNGKLFLIGPVTGIEGIYLGPFFYWLMVPFYFLGGGNPVFPAAFFSVLTILAIFLIFWLAKEIYGYPVALLSAFLYGFSLPLVIFSRWMANPNPLPFFALVTLIFLWRFIDKKDNKSLIGASFFLGLCLQCEAASAIFFLPATLIIILWQKRVLSKLNILFFSFIAFFVTLLPQIFFDLRHQGILRSAFKTFLIGDKSFNFSLFETVKVRFILYFDTFFGKLLPQNFFKLALLAFFFLTLYFFRKQIFQKGGKLLAIWLASPLFFFLFYQGNHGYVWDYYFTGVIPAFIILFSSGIFFLTRKVSFSKVIIGAFLILFATINLKGLADYYKAGLGISLSSQLKAIDWVYQDARGKDFNTDVYVPPQIPYAYTYLFKWYGITKYGYEPKAELVKNLYTLYEPDSQHPNLLENWLVRQDTIGKIERSNFWGEITVQKRERI